MNKPGQGRKPTSLKFRKKCCGVRVYPKDLKVILWEYGSIQNFIDYAIKKFLRKGKQ